MVAGGVRIGSITQSEMLEAYSLDGDYGRWIGQSWIVRVFTVREHRFRDRLLDVEGNALALDLFGDLRLLRNDIVHHSGKATKRNAGRVRLLRSWASVGDPISVGFEQLAQFTNLIPWDRISAIPAASQPSDV
jgi:hypothetical protein